MEIVVSPKTQYCHIIPKRSRARTATSVVIRAWDGHEAVLGCVLCPVHVHRTPPSSRQSDKGGRVAQLNHVIVSISVPARVQLTNLSAGEPLPECRVDFVAAVSVDAARECKSQHKDEHPLFVSMKFPPRLVRPSASHRPTLDFVSIEFTHSSSVLPFVVARPTEAQWQLASLLPQAEPYHDDVNVTATVNADDHMTNNGTMTQRSRRLLNLDAPVRCDQGLYMGFTNIVEALVTCVVFAVFAGRNHVEFPAAFHHGTFASLFDEQRLHSGVLEHYGVWLTLLPPPLPVVSPPYAVYPRLPRLAEQAPVLAQSAQQRPGARLFCGDVWQSRINSFTEYQQTKWFQQRTFAPSAELGRFSVSLTGHMRSLALNASRDDGNGTALAQLNNSTHNGTHAVLETNQQNASTNASLWVGMHLRLEADSALMGKQVASFNGAATLTKIRKQMRQRFGASDIPTYYASGELPAAVAQQLSPQWRSKNDFYDKGHWNETYEGKWFNGRRYSITNSTGSMVDMLVVLEAPFAVLSEYSSFSEYVGALRCSMQRPSVMYDSHGTFHAVDCGRLLLFQRAWNEINRKIGCDRLTALLAQAKANGDMTRWKDKTEKCGVHLAKYNTYVAAVKQVDDAVAHGVEKFRNRTATN
jgi:hypothetical protein